jgi:peptidylprolyl isomerase
VVGRVISGMEWLSSLPRGKGDGVLPKPGSARRSPGSGWEAMWPGCPRGSICPPTASFAAYLDARANRRDPFYVRPAGGVDICNVPVPVRVTPARWNAGPETGPASPPPCPPPGPRCGRPGPRRRWRAGR